VKEGVGGNIWENWLPIVAGDGCCVDAWSLVVCCGSPRG
jgi:hypothetical protein